MYKTCPKCHYQRRAEDTGSADVCPNCGLIFSKWMRSRFRRSTEDSTPVRGEERQGRLTALLDYLLHEQGAPEPVVLWGRVILYLGLVLWGGYFIMLEMDSNAIGNSFMHNINLVFHEAGHVIFRLFGRFMTILGGSLLQILVPLIVAGAFLFQYGNRFAASVGLWWAGQSMMDIAPYINDARARQLPLLGGGDGRDRPWMHDWYNILGDLNLLRSDHAIASFVDMLGEFTVLLALAWGGYLLWQQFGRVYRGR